MNYEGVKVSEEILLGRNYFQCRKHRVSKYNHEYKFDELGRHRLMTSAKTKIFFLNTMNYIASEHVEEMLAQMESTEIDPNRVWFKCLPVESEIEHYIIICVYVGEDWRIKEITPFARFMDPVCNTGKHPCEELLASQFVKLYTHSDTVNTETCNLCKGKYLCNQFRIVGKLLTEKLLKRLKKGKEANSYYFNKTSAFRNAECTFRIDVDDNMVIEKMACQTCKNRHCIMQPKNVSISNDYAEFYDCMLYISDNWE